MTSYLIWSGIFVALGFLSKGLTNYSYLWNGNFCLFYLSKKQLLNYLMVLLNWKAWLAFINNSFAVVYFHFERNRYQ